MREENGTGLQRKEEREKQKGIEKGVFLLEDVGSWVISLCFFSWGFVFPLSLSLPPKQPAVLASSFFLFCCPQPKHN